MNALRFARLAALRLLRFGFGAPWILLVLAGAYLARSQESLDAANGPWLRAALHLLIGAAAAFGVAVFAPCSFLAFHDGRSIDVLAASRPAARAARAIGTALGCAAAAAAVFGLFVASLFLVNGSLDGALRQRRASLDPSASELRANGDSLRAALPEHHNSELRLAPLLGAALGYGDAEPVFLRLQFDTAAPVEIELRGRAPALVAAPDSARELAITKTGGAPVARWPADSLALVGAPLATPAAAAALGARILAIVVFLSFVSAAAGCLFEAPVASLAAATVGFLVILAGMPAALRAVDAGALLDWGSLLSRELPAVSWVSWIAPPAAAALLASIAPRLRPRIR
jgi:hypothetical protein